MIYGVVHTKKMGQRVALLKNTYFMFNRHSWNKIKWNNRNRSCYKQKLDHGDFFSCLLFKSINRLQTQWEKEKEHERCFMHGKRVSMWMLHNLVTVMCCVCVYKWLHKQNWIIFPSLESKRINWRRLCGCDVLSQPYELMPRYHRNVSRGG